MEERSSEGLMLRKYQYGQGCVSPEGTVRWGKGKNAKSQQTSTQPHRDGTASGLSWPLAWAWRDKICLSLRWNGKLNN